MTLHPATQALLDHIRRDDIGPEHPQWRVVRSLSYSATELVSLLPEGGAELTVGLRKLLEAQDAFLRCGLPRGADIEPPVGVQELAGGAAGKVYTPR